MEEGQEVLMGYLDQVMSYQIVEGTTVGDVFTVNFLVDATGNIILAAILITIGFFPCRLLQAPDYPHLGEVPPF